MRKRKFLMLPVMVVGIVVLFAASEVMAFCDYCEPPIEQLELTNSSGKSYTIELEEIEPIGSRFLWKYAIYDSNNPNKLTKANFVAMLVPDCCTDPAIDLNISESDPAADLQTFDVAVGEQTKYFGRGITQGWVIKSPPDKTKFHLSFNTNLKANTTIYLETSGGPLYYEMVGPSCTIPEALPQGVRTSAEVKKIIQGEYAFCLKARENEMTHCYETAAYACVPTSGDCLDVEVWCPLEKQEFDTTTTVQFSGTPECENVIIVPDDAAYNLCYNPDIVGDPPDPQCLGGPLASSTDGTSYANPCGKNCVECKFGGWAYCACW